MFNFANDMPANPLRHDEHTFYTEQIQGWIMGLKMRWSALCSLKNPEIQIGALQRQKLNQPKLTELLKTAWIKQKYFRYKLF